MQSNLPVLVSETDTHTLSNVKGCLFRVPKFLQLEKALGAGAYGLVWYKLYMIPFSLPLS